MINLVNTWFNYWIIHHFICIAGKNSKPQEKVIPNNNTFSATITQLRKYYQYAIQVLAYTRLGDGALSSPSLLLQTHEDGESMNYLYESLDNHIHYSCIMRCLGSLYFMYTIYHHVLVYTIVSPSRLEGITLLQTFAYSTKLGQFDHPAYPTPHLSLIHCYVWGLNLMVMEEGTEVLSHLCLVVEREPSSYRGDSFEFVRPRIHD